MAEVATKPGFYWYKPPYGAWDIVRVLPDRGGVPYAWYVGIPLPDVVADMYGEWGPEIVHAD